MTRQRLGDIAFSVALGLYYAVILAAIAVGMVALHAWIQEWPW